MALAILVIAANPRRPASRMWALALTCQALWQASIGVAQIYTIDTVLAVRLAGFTGLCWLWGLSTLYDTVLTPWSSLRTVLFRPRWDWWILLAAVLELTPLMIPTLPARRFGEGPLFWPSYLGAMCWTAVLVAKGLLLWARGAGGERRRSEMLAFVIMAASTLGVAMLNVSGLIFASHERRWLSPIVLWVAYLLGGVALWRSHLVLSRDVGRTLALLLARTVVYGSASCAAVVGVRFFVVNDMNGALLLAWLLIAFGAALLPTVDSILQSIVERRFTSPSYLKAQASTNTLIRSDPDSGMLHSGYALILQDWSDGSEEVYLSDGAFTARWPAEPMPLSLLRLLGDQGAVTPETAERGGPAEREEFEYLTRHRIGAAVCATGDAGERLIAAFEARAARGPFLPRELREARSLLATMQMGSALERMTQRLRGNERLRFYARYAPQFAHELRNGLYLQTQLLKAIAAGRGGEVQAEDARLSLAQTEQVDRLCDHFFNVGALFNRPIESMALRATLEAFLEGLRAKLPIARTQWVELAFGTEDSTEILANRELLRMALHNLVKNGLEASPADAGGPAVEISVSRELDKVHLLVRDHGRGLPELRRTDPFAPGRSNKRDGMGLGLSIARDCVEAMGGTVGVRRTGPDGTCFEITLMCAKRFDGAAVPCSLITRSVPDTER
ncbi:MAG: sensor histidine kinase [Opitutaceae bacterium]